MLWLAHDARSDFTRAIGGLIAAAIINDDDFARNFCPKAFTDHVRYRLFLVERGDDDGDVAHRRTSHAPVK